jgi:hypothetical protein
VINRQLALDAERTVLGGMMLGGAERASQLLKPEDFAEYRHQLVFEHLVELWAAGLDVGPTSVLKRLADRGQLTRPETGIYLASLLEVAAIPAQIGHYAGIVREEAERRWQMTLADKMARATEIDDPETRRLQLAEIATEAAAGVSGTRSSRLARRVDLLPFLNGTYVPPPPSVGGERDDNRQLLYPGRWHTLIAPTASGKSWFAVWHVVAELRRGNTVAYAHFEEHSPAGMVARIRAVAPDLTVEDLADRFVWLDCSTAWGGSEFAGALPNRLALVVLDGIVAACSQHGWVADKPEAVGGYRSRFVTPATKAGAAVLSLGHPVKAKDRQTERHGFGASAWLDEVDGAAFRLEASKSPIRRGERGYSALFSVKDRYGEVELSGRLDSRRDAWFYLGAFTVDSSGMSGTAPTYLTAPAALATAEGTPDGPAMPEGAMVAISTALAGQQHPLSQTAVEHLVNGRAQTKRAALEFLVNLGYVARIKHGQAFKYSHIRPYEITSDEDDE